jgi:hypothetical protein
MQTELKKIKQARRWLKNLKQFLTELELFIQQIPLDTQYDSLNQIPTNVTTDKRFTRLCTSSQHCRYLADIPTQHCFEEIKDVQEEAHRVTMKIYRHPILDKFHPNETNAMRPFYEKTFYMGLALSVEHGYLRNTLTGIER